MIGARTAAEMTLIRKVWGPQASISAIVRLSPRPFDLRVEGAAPMLGVPSGPVKFSAWLPLATIRQSNWPRLARYTDHPEMVKQGDWSGVRDSSQDTLWAIFPLALAEVLR